MTSASCANLVELGVYVHVPFCGHRCPYCTFYQELPRRADVDAYAAALGREWALRKVEEPITTLFFGGGTPGILSCEHFSQIAAGLGIGPSFKPVEWTVEFSPETVKFDKLLQLKDLGATRLSIGVQSFAKKTLGTLGRRQGMEKIIRAIDLAKNAGFSLNLDLIFCVPGQTLAEWKDDLRRTIDFAPDHISTYVLTGENFGKFAKLRHSATAGERFCRVGWDILQNAGYEHYEVSNFARPGHRCRHNLNTWRMGSWLGLGPAAASQWQGRRFRNVANLRRWLEGIGVGQPREEEIQPLTDKILLEDALIFALRTRDGIDRRVFAERHGKIFFHHLPLLECWTARRWLEERGDRLCVTDAGLLLADALGLEILLMNSA
jgi:oxygen-independent coproporphyrinogen-3 oxidase